MTDLEEGFGFASLFSSEIFYQNRGHCCIHLSGLNSGSAWQILHTIMFNIVKLHVVKFFVGKFRVVMVVQFRVV